MKKARKSVKSKIRSVVAILLTVIVLVGICPMGGLTVYAAEERVSVTTVTAPVNANPLHAESAGTIRTITPRQYYSGDTAEDIASLCTEEYTAIVERLRTGFENRDPQITLYYKPAADLGDDDGVVAFMDALTQDALDETDKATQGDALRYALGPGSSECHKITDQEEIGDYYAIVYNMTYYTTKEQESELTAAVDALIDDFNFSPSDTDLQKVTAIYDYITATVTYDYDHYGDESYQLQFTAYAALMHKTAVCQGYAALFYRLAEECGVDTRIIPGVKVSNNEPHAWNIAKIGDVYYYLDATWDAGKYTYAYFLKGTTDFSDHQPRETYLTDDFKATYPMPETGYTQFPAGNGSGVAGDFEYTLSGGRATITQYNGTAEDVVVPSLVNGYPVKVIAKSAFFYNGTVKTLTLSEGIETLSDPDGNGNVIYGCENLTQLHLPSTFRFTVNEQVGYSDVPNTCEKLSEITVASNNPYIKAVDNIVYSKDGTQLVYFPSGSARTAFTLPDGVTEICPKAFNCNPTIDTIDLGNTVTDIGFQAFIHCRNLAQLTLSDTCEYIGQYALMYCDSLTALHLPRAVNWIRDDAFAEAANLTTITVDAENTVYYAEGGSLFSYAGCLVRHLPNQQETTYSVPEGISRIGTNAFYNCNTLRQITLPEGVVYVDSYAFNDCAALEQIVFPDTTEQIGRFVFSGCYRLASVVIPANAELPLKSYEGSDTNGLWLHDDCTVYGTDNQEATTDPDNVRAKEFATVNGLAFQPIAAFQCATGHNLQHILVDDPAGTEDACVTYRCTVCGCNSEIVSVWSVLPTLSRPENLTGVLIRPDAIKVSWDAVAQADGYAVYMAVSGSELELYTRTTDCEIILSDLPRNTHYYFRVFPTSLLLGEYFDAVERDDCQLMTAPVLVASERFITTSLGTTQVELFWDRVEGAFDYQILYKKATDSEFAEACVVTTNACTVTGLTGGTTYDFKLVPRYTGYGLVVECDNPNTLQVTTQPAAVTVGDPDGNATVTANDALMALQAATGKIGLDETIVTAADVDGTSGVTANDALLILQYATKKIASFPVAG